MSDDSISRTLTVTLVVCFVCSVLVASAAVSLRGIQEKNKKTDKIKNILEAGQLYTEGSDVLELYDEKVEPVLIELATGNKIPKSQFTDELSVDSFDIKSMSNSPRLGIDVPPTTDIAGIRRKPKYMVVYMVKENDRVNKIIFPVYGKGLWSTMYGFIALGADLTTIEGLTFYEHGETPGLGGEIDNPRWKSSWRGKAAFDKNGNTAISVIKGKVLADKPQAIHQVDGLSGATLTGRGVDHLIKYWLGKEGYGPFLQKTRLRGGHEKV